MSNSQKEIQHIFVPAKGPKRINKPWSIGAVATLLILGILMPLFGLSVLVIFIVETIIYFTKKTKEA
jgi:uncharacterized iron-regulated membrane protein